jgi:hypothetical protein
MICSDQKVVQIIHNNPITPNTTGCGYNDCEETTSKAKQNETLQQKPIKTTESHHDFHHTEQSMKSRLQPSNFPFAMNNTNNHSRENTMSLHSFQPQENTDQYITEPTFISYTERVHGWVKKTYL